MIDWLWGPDVGVIRFYARLFLKIMVSLLLGYLVHQYLVSRIFVSSKDLDTSQMQTELNSLLCKSVDGGTIDVNVTLTRTDDELAYRVVHQSCSPPAAPTISDPAASSTDPKTAPQAEANPASTLPPMGAIAMAREGKFYVLERISLLKPFLVVTRPQLQDSIHVMLRNIEAAWRGNSGGEVQLCAESRRLLGAPDCNHVEDIRKMLEGDLPRPGTTRSEPSLLISHLQAVRWGALLLGPVQFTVLVVFLYSLIETVGLRARWLWAPSYVSKFVESGLSNKLTADDRAKFELKLAEASHVRVRAFVDRFLEKALSPSTTVAESRLRNFRDLVLDDCVSHIDTLEMIGDTMLKIAFLGTVYGIGSSLFEARNLDASDPLVRLVSKSAMYAGIGMGFGATLVGIALSIVSAKLRAWLSTAWMSEIDRAWRQATTFYDINYSTKTLVGVSGVDSVPVRYHPKSRMDKALDRILTTAGIVAIVFTVYLLLSYGHFIEGFRR